MQLRELTNDEFDKFSRNFNFFSLYQTREYSFIMHKEGYETSTIGLFDNREIVGAALILIKEIEKRKYAYIPRGYLLDYNDYSKLKSMTNLIKRFLKKRNVVAIKICPSLVRNIYDIKGDVIYTNPDYLKCFNNFRKLEYRHLGYNNGFEALKPRFEAYIDLKEKSIEELFKDIKKEYRTKIRSAVTKGIKIYKGKETSINELYKLTEKKYPRKESYLEDAYRYFDEKGEIEYFYAKLDTKEFLSYAQKKFLHYEDLTYKMDERIMSNTGRNTGKTITKKMNLDKKFESAKIDLTTATSILRDYPEGVTLAGVYVIKHDKEANILIDGYNSNYKYLNAKHYLIWSLIEKYKSEGYEKFNLGGIPGFKCKDASYDGLRMFKLNFGSKVVEYAGDFELLTKKNFLFFSKAKNIKKN